MKNIVVSFCLLFTSVTLHCMELKPDYKESEKRIDDACKAQLRVALEKYKNGNAFESETMNRLAHTANWATHSDNGIEYIHCTKDDQNNGFFQEALKKTDQKIIQWLIDEGNIGHHSIKECEDFITFCTEQLSPSTEENKRNSAYGILKSIIEHYKTNAAFQERKELYIKTIIELQLEHEEASNSEFTMDEDLLTPFSTQDNLSNQYQTIVNKDGNTLAHILVEKHAAGKLHTAVKKNCVSKITLNNAGKTVYDLALDKFLASLNDTMLDISSSEANSIRCCYYMLEKYFSHSEDKENCCKEHIISKKFGESSRNNSQDPSPNNSQEPSRNNSQIAPSSLSDDPQETKKSWYSGLCGLCKTEEQQ